MVNLFNIFNIYTTSHKSSRVMDHKSSRPKKKIELVGPMLPRYIMIPVVLKLIVILQLLGHGLRIVMTICKLGHPTCPCAYAKGK